MIHLVGIGAVAADVLDPLAARLARTLGDSCHVRSDRIDPAFAFDPVRSQYHATAILRRLASVRGPEQRLLGVAAVDLYVPIFTFVFGEAQVAGAAAVVSTFRLQQEFYGLPAEPELTEERLAKSSMHELGHTYGLRHCHDWSCPMAASTAIERLDLKYDTYCDACQRAIFGG